MATSNAWVRGLAKSQVTRGVYPAAHLQVVSQVISFFKIPPETGPEMHRNLRFSGFYISKAPARGAFSWVDIITAD